MTAQICCKISPKGQVEIGTNGIVGPGCTSITERLRNELGVVDNFSHTHEYTQSAEESVKQTN